MDLSQMCGKSVAMNVIEKVDEQKSQQLGLSFVDLPPAITTLILLRLPIKYIMVCKSVCKSLNNLISDPQFAKLHFKQASIGFMIRTNYLTQPSMFMHLLEYEPEKFDNSDDDQCCYCEDDFTKLECNNHVKLELKFKLPAHCGKLILEKRNGSTGRRRIYTNYEPKYEKLDVVNSCNGFLCLSDCAMEYFVVCNPVTGELIRLPEATKMDETKYSRQLVYPGFGFNPKTNEYKVLRILERFRNFRNPKRIMIVDIHTLGTSKWRNVEVNLKNISWLFFPTYVNGAFHWINYHDNKWSSLLCFNFERERFRHYPTPPDVFNQVNDVTNHITMGDLGGFLYLCDSSSLDTSITMWIMKECGIGKSWTKVFSIDTMDTKCWPYGGFYWPVKHFNNGAAVLMCHSSNLFIHYEPKKHVFKCFKVRGTKSQRLEIIPHVPSFISLKAAVNGDNIRLLDVESRSTNFKLVEENEALFLAKVIPEVDEEYTS